MLLLAYVVQAATFLLCCWLLIARGQPRGRSIAVLTFSSALGLFWLRVRLTWVVGGALIVLPLLAHSVVAGRNLPRSRSIVALAMAVAGWILVDVLMVLHVLQHMLLLVNCLVAVPPQVLVILLLFVTVHDRSAIGPGGTAQSPHCRGCGAKITSDAVFCEHCGIRVGQDGPGS